MEEKTENKAGKMGMLKKVVVALVIIILLASGSFAAYTLYPHWQGMKEPPSFEGMVFENNVLKKEHPTDPRFCSSKIKSKSWTARVRDQKDRYWFLGLRFTNSDFCSAETLIIVDTKVIANPENYSGRPVVNNKKVDIFQPLDGVLVFKKLGVFTNVSVRNDELFVTPKTLSLTKNSYPFGEFLDQEIRFVSGNFNINHTQGDQLANEKTKNNG